MSGHWRVESEAISSGGIKVTKFVSSLTGMKLVLADVSGPLVKGYLCLATEAHDDDGLPHTLEHLVFTGSRQMPYKGVLDLISNRCLSSGTNAWTDIDHTCYTMETAGSQGFLNMLPVYIEHVLFPTLTAAAYKTEVHHINGDGEDAGVIYCEMQGRENSDADTVVRELERALFPGRCGYKSQTGGILKNLRESTSHEKVVAYHKSFYCPDNLCIVVTGSVEPEALFSVIDKVEQLVEERTTPFSRPWMSECPPLKKSVEKSVSYPSDEEDNGLVYIAWRGLDGTDLVRNLATICLMEYLTESSVSPLQAVFVECDDPCASSVSYTIVEQSDCVIRVTFDNVPLGRLSHVKGMLMETLESIDVDTFDQSRMKVVIQRRIAEHLAAEERYPHDLLAGMAIGDTLYGRDEKDFAERMDPVRFYKSFLDETSIFWICVLEKILSGPSVTVLGLPSVALQATMAEDEEERVKQQQEKLGVNGLEQKATELDDAINENEKKPPKELLAGFKIPNVDSISFHGVECTENDALIPTFLCRVKTEFAFISAILDTSTLPIDLRPYLPLLSELLLESNLCADESSPRLSHEEVIRQLNEDTLGRFSHLGISSGGRFQSGAFSQHLRLELHVEKEKVASGCLWLQQLLTRSDVSSEGRVRIVATKMLNSIADMKREGRIVTNTVSRVLNFSPNCNQRINSLLYQQDFLQRLLKDLEVEEKKGQILAALAEAQKRILECITIFVARSTLDPPSNLASVWKDRKSQVIPTFHRDSEFCTIENCPIRHCVVGLGALETSYVLRTVKGITCREDPDLAPLKLYFQYVTQIEGPMWRKLRGEGLVYGYNLSVNVNQGTLVLGLTKSTHPDKAFEAALKLLHEPLEEGFVWDEQQLEAAKSSLIFEEVEALQSVAGVVEEALFNLLYRESQDFKRSLMERILSVTISDLNRVGKKLVRRFLSPEESSTVVVCRPSKVSKVEQDFNRLGTAMKAYSNLEAFYSSLVKGENGTSGS